MLILNRRHMALGLGGALILPLLPATARAADLPSLPRQTEGPYYPDILPADTDNDLVRVADAARQAGGEILDLSGVVRDVSGRPLPGARVEIWQADAGGRYIHTGDRRGRVEKDAYFQGYGLITVGEDGSYSFRTIRPVGYGEGGFARTPHIHLKVHRPDTKRVLTSQLYVNDEPQNADDWLFRRLSSSEKQAASMVLAPADGDAQWLARHDLVVA